MIQQHPLVATFGNCRRPWDVKESWDLKAGNYRNNFFPLFLTPSNKSCARPFQACLITHKTLFNYLISFLKGNSIEPRETIASLCFGPRSHWNIQSRPHFFLSHLSSTARASDAQLCSFIKEGSVIQPSGWVLMNTVDSVFNHRQLHFDSTFLALDAKHS